MCRKVGPYYIDAAVLLGAAVIQPLILISFIKLIINCYICSGVQNNSESWDIFMNSH